MPASYDGKEDMLGTGRLLSLLLPLIGGLLLAEAGLLALGIGDLRSSGATSGGATVSEAQCNGSGGSFPQVRGEAPPAGIIACYHFSLYHLSLSSPIQFCVNPDGGPLLRRPLVDYANQAVSMWEQAVGETLPISVSGTCPGVLLHNGDGKDVIGWAELGGSRVGLTNVKYHHGIVAEADISLESGNERLPESCLLAVLLHEMGHAMGLDHQPTGDSIMRPVTDCPSHPSPSASDVAAVRYLYPQTGAGFTAEANP